MFLQRRKNGAHYILKELGEKLGMNDYILYALKDGSRLPSSEDVRLLKECGVIKKR